MAPDLDGKRLELLKEAVPKVARVAFLWQPGGTRGNLALTDMEAPAKALGLKLLPLEVRSLDDFEGAFARAKKERAQALITTTGSLINTQQRRVLDLATKNRLPAIYHYNEFVEAGGLMSYGPDNTDLWRRAADFVDKILKGAKPADLPVQQATKFEFLVNMNAAKQIDLTIPPSVLARADKVIKLILDCRFSITEKNKCTRHLECALLSSAPTIENPKPVVSLVEPSKIENWWGSLLSLSHSQCVGRWPRRSRQEKSPALVSWIQAMLLVWQGFWGRSSRS